MAKPKTTKRKPVKKKKSQLSAKNPIHIIRCDLVRSRIAREEYNHEIVEWCQEQPAFKHTKTGKPLSSARIRIWYIVPTRKAILETPVDFRDQMHASIQRMIEALRIAAKAEDPKAMALVQKVLNKMIGLRREPILEGEFDATKLRQQLTEIHESIGGTE